MKIHQGGKRRPRSRRAKRVKTPQELCPCVPQTGDSGGYVHAVVHYYSLQKKLKGDATLNEFIEHCHPVSHHCPDGNCELMWVHMCDYEEAWVSEDPHEDLHEGGEFRISSINPAKVSFKDMQTVSRWIHFSLSQAARRRAK